MRAATRLGQCDMTANMRAPWRSEQLAGCRFGGLTHTRWPPRWSFFPACLRGVVNCDYMRGRRAQRINTIMMVIIILLVAVLVAVVTRRRSERDRHCRVEAAWMTRRVIECATVALDRSGRAYVRSFVRPSVLPLVQRGDPSSPAVSHAAGDNCAAWDARLGPVWLRTDRPTSASTSQTSGSAKPHERAN